MYLYVSPNYSNSMNRGKRIPLTNSSQVQVSNVDDRARSPTLVWLGFKEQGACILQVAQDITPHPCQGSDSRSAMRVCFQVRSTPSGHPRLGEWISVLNLRVGFQVRSRGIGPQVCRRESFRQFLVTPLWGRFTFRGPGAEQPIAKHH